MKSLLRFDAKSITPTVISQLTAANTAIRLVDDDVYLYEYDAAVLSHALLLLGQNPVRFGYDISHYLTSAALFYSRRSTAQRVSIDFGPSDFKKRMAEDVAIAQASIFMTSSYGVLWETIAQIPENRKLSKMRPDFEGFSANGDRSLFEVKGTTVTKNVEPAIVRGVDQVKRYPEAAVRKMVIASYFSCDSRSFPNFMFVIDPEMPDVVLPDRDTAILLHQIKTLEFLKLDDARKHYGDYLRNEFAVLHAEKAGTTNTRAKLASGRAKDAFIRSMAQAVQNPTADDSGVVTLYRDKVKVDGEHYEIALGVVQSVLTPLSQLAVVDQFPKESRVTASDSATTSAFTDGTVFTIRRI